MDPAGLVHRHMGPTTYPFVVLYFVQSFVLFLYSGWPSLYSHTLSGGGSSTGPPCTRTSQPSYSPPPASSPAPVRLVHGLDVVLHLGALAVAPSVVPNMVSKTRGIGRQLFVERLTVPGPPGPWPRFCCLTWAAHDMFQHFLDPAGIKRPLGLPT